MTSIDRLAEALRHGWITRREFMRRASGLGLAAALPGALAASQSSPRAPSAGFQPGLARSAAENEIRIGAIYPLSGSFAPVAVEFKNAAEMALDFINGVNGAPSFATSLPLAQGAGIPNLGGARLRIIFADSQGKPEIGQNEADRLINNEGCIALFGCYQSSVTVTASQTAERYGIPFINPDSSSPTLTRRGLQNFVRIQPDEILFSRNFFDFLKDLKSKRPGITASRLALLHEQTEWGTNSAKAQMDFASQYGYEVVADITHPTPASQVTSEVQKLKAAKPDILIQSSYFAEVSLFMKAYRELDFNVDALIGNDAGFTDEPYLKNMGADGDYIITRAMWADDLAGKKELARSVSQHYKQRFNIEFTENAGLPFMAVFVLADALNRAGTTDSGPLLQAIKSTTFSVDQNIFPWGIQFDDAQGGQNPLATAVIQQVIKNKYVTVWPFDVAAGDLVWPMPAWSQR